MPSKEDYLQRGSEILSLLAREHIQLGQEPRVESDRIINKKLTLLRQSTYRLAQGLPMSGLTSCVAVTLLQVGACQELAQRVAFEYFKKYQQKEVSLIFLANLDNVQHHNHAFVLLGSIKAAPHLITAQGNQDATIYSHKSHNSELATFLQAQPSDCVLVDPFLQCCTYANSPSLPSAFSDYCLREKITHVVAVKRYQHTPGLVENMDLINRNVVKIATHANRENNLYYLNKIIQALFPEATENWQWIAKVDCFGVKGLQENLSRLQHLFQENGFCRGLTLTQTVHKKEPMLVIRQANTLDLSTMITLANNIGHRVSSSTITCGLNR